MMGAAVSGAISKTINMPTEATVEDIMDPHGVEAGRERSLSRRV
jgi:hypothetical protein